MSKRIVVDEGKFTTWHGIDTPTDETRCQNCGAITDMENDTCIFCFWHVGDEHFKPVWIKDHQVWVDARSNNWKPVKRKRKRAKKNR